ncbi:MAG: hypothetical protein MUO72_00070 [Bacteroidales bacterium]|nr:hypothetical protein [Bacteroidales bacterium]
MKKDNFLLEFIKSAPFRILLIIAILVTLGVIFASRKEKKVRMKEDVLYIQPKPKE